MSGLNRKPLGHDTGFASGFQPGKTQQQPPQPPVYKPGPGFLGNDSGIAAGLLPNSKMSHSDWMYQTARQNLLNENPTQGARDVRQDKQIFFNGFADYARSNPAQLRRTLYLYMADTTNWIFEFFPIKIDPYVRRIIQQHVETEATMPHIGTRKVPFRRISARMTAKEYHTIGTKQGFSMDYNFLKFDPGAMQTWDMMVDAIVANIWSYVIFLALTELQTDPSTYYRDSQLYPYNERPQNTDELFAWERLNCFRPNKEPQAINTIIAGVDKVMSQKTRTCTGLIMSKDTAWYMQARDPTQNMYNKSGPIALRNRAFAGRTATLGGVTLYPIPLARGKAHDEFYRGVLNDRFQTGGWGRSPENTLHLPAEKYLSTMRFVGLPAVTKNGFHRYSLYDALRHAPEFYPINFGRNEAKAMRDADAVPDELPGDGDADLGYAGEINVALLHQLANEAPEVFAARMKTRLAGNEDRLNVFLRRTHAPPPAAGAPDQRYAPVRVFGEISRTHMKAQYLNGTFDTFQRAMFDGLSKEDIVKFERGIRLAEEMNNAPEDRLLELLQLVRNNRVMATEDFSERGMRDYDTPSSLGVRMYDPNEHGGPDFDVESIIDENSPQSRPWGMGNISGFLTVLDVAARTYRGLAVSFFDEEDVRVIRDFMALYRQVVANAAELTFMHPCLSPLLVPIHHSSENMSTETRRMIVFWYTIVRPFTAPMQIIDDNNWPLLTQFASTQAQNTGLIGFPLELDAMIVKHNVIASDTPAHFKHDVVQEKSFGGSLFTALPYVHPMLPALSGSSGEIDSLLRSIPEASHLTTKNAMVAPSRIIEWDGAESKEEMEAVIASRNYTHEYLSALRKDRLIKQYPRFIAHIIANPLAVHSKTHVTDFDIRIMQSHTRTVARGIAERFCLYSQITLQTLRLMEENNLRIPLGVTLLRPHEEQMVESGFAIASTNIGTTYFSGIDNNVSFDANSQHFTVQAFAYTRTAVKDNSAYLELPLLRGGPFIGGKGHEFVNQDEPLPLPMLEEVKETVGTCNAQRLGSRSIIACVASLNSAVEKVKYPCFDVRNGYRRENFAGRLMRSTRDFVDERADLAYDGAPLLNHIFQWDNRENQQILDQQSLRQRMDNMSRNYVVRMTTNEIWDEKTGIAHTQSFHIWGNLETDNLLYTQQSYADVPSAQ